MLLLYTFFFSSSFCLSLPSLPVSPPPPSLAKLLWISSLIVGFSPKVSVFAVDGGDVVYHLLLVVISADRYCSSIVHHHHHDHNHHRHHLVVIGGVGVVFLLLFP